MRRHALVAVLFIAPLAHAASPLEGTMREYQDHLKRGGQFAEFAIRNAPKSASAWRAAADKGGPVGQFFWGLCLGAGAGVKTDLPEAVRLFTKASDAGVVEATAVLGMCKYSGFGTKRDREAGEKLLRSAMEKGSGFAALELAYRRRGEGRPDFAELRKFYEAARKLGYSAGDFFLGRMARDAEGMRRNLTIAERHYGAAVKGGHHAARMELAGVLELRGAKAEAKKYREAYLLTELKNSGRRNFFAGKWTGMLTDNKGKRSRYTFLFADDGTPLLLDFNLAHDSHDDHSSLGGTVAYMAPEHLQALASRDPAQAARIDHRSDIYSLGMVIYEMLAGRRPHDHSASYGSGSVPGRPLPSGPSALTCPGAWRASCCAASPRGRRTVTSGPKPWPRTSAVSSPTCPWRTPRN